jgi:hypothetical protein
MLYFFTAECAEVAEVRLKKAKDFCPQHFADYADKISKRLEA